MNEITKIGAIQHILLRPGMVIGNTTLTKSNEFVFEDNKIIKKEIEHVPAFLKIFREILDNSIDENIRTEGKFSNKIIINIDQNRMKISIEDNGRGLSSEFDEKYNIPKAVLAVTESMAGSNWTNETSTIGQNGIGSFGTNVYSKLFELDTSDGKKRTRLICKNNLSEKIYTQTNNKKHFTNISFIPDFKRLSMSRIDDIHYNAIYKNILDVSLAFPKIKFYFNNKLIKNKNFKDYVKLYSNESEVFSFENCDIAVIHNQELDYVSFVNGINTKNGGNHIDFVAGNISYKLRDLLVKKYKTIKPIDIRNNCFFIINIKNMIAPRFDSQLKEHLTSPVKDINNLLSDVEFDTIAKHLFKSDTIIYPIIETFKIKEDLRCRAELKNKEKKIEKKKVIPKLIEANSKNRNKCELFLSEGDSAQGMAILVRNSDYQAFYPISGKFVNAYDLSPSELIKKKGVTDLLSIIGLKLSSPDISNLNYSKIVIMTDEDTDGNAIAALLINFFYKYWSDLIFEKKLYKAKSFLILAKHKETGKEKKFFSVEEFKQSKDYDLLEYNKGLGSLEENDYRDTLKNLTLITNNSMLADEKLKIAFSKEGDRKTWMRI